MLDYAENPLKLKESHVLHRSVYYDKEIYAQEQEKIFKSTWQYVAHESELKNTGDFVAATIAEQDILVTRNKKGGLSAFYNNCTHRGANITGERKGNCRSAFKCMYHGWTFNLEGKLTGIPRPDSYGKLDRSSYDIPNILVDSYAGFVFVCFNPEVEPLAEFLDEAGDALGQSSANHEVIGGVSFIYNGNWKLWSENFRDGYHAEYTHPLVGAVFKSLDRSAGTITGYKNGHGKIWWPLEGNPENIPLLKARLLGSEVEAPDRAMTRAMPPFDINFRAGNSILSFFPNMDVQNLMGGSEHVLQVARPLGVDRTRIDLSVLAPVGENEGDRQWRLDMNMDAQASSGKVTADDTEVARRITSAVKSDGVEWTPLSRGGEEDEAAIGQQTTVGHKTDDHALRSYYEAWKRYMRR